MNKRKIAIIGLSIGIFVFGQYAIYEKTTESRQSDLSNAYQNGYNVGAFNAITALYKQTENCHSTTLGIGNLTRIMIDLSCLKSVQNNSTR